MQVMTRKTRLRLLARRLKLPLIIAFAVLSLSGCDIPDRHDIAALRRPAVWEIGSQTPVLGEGQTQLSNVSALTPKEKESAAEWEFWYLHQLESVIGGVAMRSENVSDTDQPGESLIKVSLSERTLKPLRLSPPMLSGADNTNANPLSDAFYMTENEQTFWHSPDGSLRKVVCSVRRGPLETSKTIRIDDGTIAIETIGANGLTKKQLSTDGPIGGPLMVYQSLRGNPLSRNEVRQAAVLLPTHDSLAQLRLRGNPPVLAKRMTGEGVQLESLNEAIGLITIGESRHRERYYWYDDEGVIQTTNIVGDPSFSFRCSEKQFEESGKPFLEQFNPIGVTFSGQGIPTGSDFERVSHLAIDVECAGSPVSEVLFDRLKVKPSPKQYVQQLNERSQRVILARQPVPGSKLNGRFQAYDSPSQPADLASNSFVDFRARSMRGILATVKSLRSLEKRELAFEINRTVHSLLTYRSLTKGFQPASEIATSTSADSTQHSILLLAMLRANGIPARMAMGLRLSRRAENSSAFVTDSVSSKFGYHAWVIAEVDGGWVSLDPTTGRPTTVDCLALNTTDLSDGGVDLLVDRMLGQLRMFDFKVDRVVIAR